MLAGRILGGGKGVLLWAASLILMALMILGVYKYRSPAEPTHAMAIMPWTAMVVGYVYFALVSGGIADSAILRVYVERSPESRKILRRSLYTALAVLIPGIALIFSDILHPENAAWFYLGFNAKSRIAWNAVLYLAYAISLAATLIALIRRGEDAIDTPLIKALAITTLATSINLEINLGMAFGANVAVAGWYGAQTGILFVAASMLLGASWQILVGVARPADVLSEEEEASLTRSYARELALASIATALVIFWSLTSLYSWGLAKILVLDTISGYLAPYFWAYVILGVLLPVGAAMLYLRDYVSARAFRLMMIPVLLGVGSYLLVPFNFGAQAARLASNELYKALAVGLAEHPTPKELLIEYLASWELVAVMGGVGLWLLLELIGERLLPLRPGEKPKRLFILR